ncbi:MAG: YibE/F family protein [Clostridium sp.]
MQLINTDMIAIEILKGISGSLGIILTVSIVALISSKIVTIKSEKLNFLSKIN